MVTVDASGQASIESIEPPRVDLDARAEKVRDLEEQICADCYEIVQDVSFFREIEPGGEVPQDWIETLGKRRAMKRHRVATAAWLSTKEAPVAISVAKSIMVGAMKVRAMERATPKSLNIAVIMPVALPAFEEKEIEDED